MNRGILDLRWCFYVNLSANGKDAFLIGQIENRQTGPSRNGRPHPRFCILLQKKKIGFRGELWTAIVRKKNPGSLRMSAIRNAYWELLIAHGLQEFSFWTILRKRFCNSFYFLLSINVQIENCCLDYCWNFPKIIYSIKWVRKAPFGRKEVNCNSKNSQSEFLEEP